MNTWSKKNALTYPYPRFFFTGIFFRSLLLLSVLIYVPINIKAQSPPSPGIQTTLTGGPGTIKFGAKVQFLPNGNLVVVDPYYDDLSGSQPVTHAGAVFLYDGRTLNLISVMTGDKNGAFVPARITVLSNGNYVVGALATNPSGNQISALRVCDAVSGCTGKLLFSNSILNAGVQTTLTNGRFVIYGDAWDLSGPIQNGAALRLCHTINDCIGLLTPQNSLMLERSGTHSLTKGDSTNL